MKNIIFIGMPGAGKTTIGKEVARTLAWPFFDSDVRLRERIHRDIKELFRESEAAFRQEETETLRELCQKEGIVLSCGGGVSANAPTGNTEQHIMAAIARARMRWLHLVFRFIVITS